jgi:uncharacterized protein (TIGR00725 family)
MGSGVDEWIERADPLGRLLADLGVHLLTGGGGGVMAAVTRAFVESPDRRGLAIGVLPAAGRGYPNEWVEIPIATHLPLSGAKGEDPRSRNHINVLSCDAIVALPGGAGTLSEVRLALRYSKSIVAWLEDRSELAGIPAECPIAGDLPAVERALGQKLADL